MEKAMIRVDVSEDEEQTIERFMARLHRNIQRIVEFQPYRHLIDLVHQATKAERQLQQDVKSSKSLSFGTRNFSGRSKSITKFAAEPSMVKGSSGGSRSNFQGTFSGKNTAVPSSKPATSNTLQWVPLPRVVEFSVSSVEAMDMYQESVQIIM